MRIIRASEQVPVPWKNGGGSASAIAGEPEGSGFDGFDWRLSGAHVGREGPFSIFPDVDRIMFILSEGRLILRGLDNAPVELTAQSPSFAFPGDVLVTAEVPDGAIRNLNLMVDRRRLRAEAERLALRGPCRVAPPPGGILLVYCEAGALAAGGQNLDRDDTLVADAPVDLAPVGLPGDGRAILFRLASL